jgi:HSP20 family protein
MTRRNQIAFPTAFGGVFDDFFPTVFGDSQRPAVAARPSVDVIEEDDRIVIKADMPGLEKDEVKVTVHDGVLSLEGKRVEQREIEADGYTRSERYMGSFARTFTLPSWADGSQIGADYTNGVLTVVIPKTEAAKPKQVEIKIG